MKVEILIKDNTISYGLHPETTEERDALSLVGAANSAKVGKNGGVTFTVELSKTAIGRAQKAEEQS